MLISEGLNFHHQHHTSRPAVQTPSATPTCGKTTHQLPAEDEVRRTNKQNKQASNNNTHARTHARTHTSNKQTLKHCAVE